MTERIGIGPKGIKRIFTQFLYQSSSVAFCIYFKKTYRKPIKELFLSTSSYYNFIIILKMLNRSFDPDSGWNRLKDYRFLRLPSVDIYMQSILKSQII